MVLRNWLEGWFSRRSSRNTRKNRLVGSRTNLESLEVRTLLTTPAFGYALALGGTGEDSVTSVVADSEGNVYVAGTFSGNVDFDPSGNVNSLTSASTTDAFIAKYDKAGNFLWVNQLPQAQGSGDPFARKGAYVALNTVQGGGVYVTGDFDAAYDFDPGPGNLTLTPGTLGTIYVASYDSHGSANWAVMQGGATAAIYPRAIAADDLGNVYTTGILQGGPADMDPSASTFALTNVGGLPNTYINKLDINGDFVWARMFAGDPAGGSYSDPEGLAVDTAHNVYVSGVFVGPTDFDPAVATTDVRTADGQGDGYLVKLDSTGALGYTVTLGASGTREDVSSVVVDSAGNAYIAGKFANSMTITSTSGSTAVTAANFSYGFLSKIDQSGALNWVKHFDMVGSTGGMGVTSLTYDNSGMLYLAGYFSGEVDFDPPSNRSITPGGLDGFLAKFTVNGSFDSALNWGGTQLSVPNQISLNGFGDIYLAGLFLGTPDFDPTTNIANLTSQGGGDGFLVKLKQQLIRPVVGNDSYSIPQGGTLNVPIPGILANDSTTSGNTLIAGFFKNLTPLGNGAISYSYDGGLVFTPEASFVGVFKAQYQAIDGGTYSDPAFINIYVGVNGSPNLNPAGDPVLTAIDEDVPQGSNNGTLISDIIASMAPKGGITDPDPGALQGLAVIGANQSAGTWQYSTNSGGNWSDFGTTNNANALLLASNPSTRVRFLPKKDYNGSAAFCAIAWDQTDGNGNGSKVTISAAGGTTAFSTTREYPTLTINSVNDAPVLTRVGMPQLDDINEDQTDLTNPGTLVSKILSNAALSGGKVKDVDTGALTGIAVIGANQTSGNWQFTTDGGLNWQNFTSTSVGNALVLASDANTRVRFQPRKDFQGDAQFTYIAWDQSDASANGSFHSIAGGGSNAYSTGRQNAQLVIHPVNDAPILNNKGNPFIDPFTHTASSSQIHGNDIPTLVSRVTSTGGSITDVDGQTASGIAVIGIGGTWEYSSDDGDTWIKIEPVSVNHALLLGWDVSTRIRLKQPGAAGVYGFTFVAWDTSSELALTYVNITAAGGTTPFSIARDTATVTVT